MSPTRLHLGGRGEGLGREKQAVPEGRAPAWPCASAGSSAGSGPTWAGRRAASFPAGGSRCTHEHGDCQRLGPALTAGVGGVQGGHWATPSVTKAAVGAGQTGTLPRVWGPGSVLVDSSASPRWSHPAAPFRCAHAYRDTCGPTHAHVCTHKRVNSCACPWARSSTAWGTRVALGSGGVVGPVLARRRQPPEQRSSALGGVRGPRWGQLGLRPLFENGGVCSFLPGFFGSGWFSEFLCRVCRQHVATSDFAHLFHSGTPGCAQILSSANKASPSARPPVASRCFAGALVPGEASLSRHRRPFPEPSS